MLVEVGNERRRKRKKGEKKGNQGKRICLKTPWIDQCIEPVTKLACSQPHYFLLFVK